MRVTDARDLRIGERVKTKYGYEVEVVSLHEHIPFNKTTPTIYVTCKEIGGCLRKFSHKELIKN